MQKKVFSYSPQTKVDDVLFNIYHHREINKDVIEHTHENCIEITIVANGTAIHHSDGRIIHLQKGDCLVTLLGGRHSIEKPKGLDLFTVSCTAELNKLVGFNLNFLHGIRELFTGHSRTIIFHLNTAEFTDVWRMLDQMDKLQSTLVSGELRSCFAILLCLLAQSYSRTVIADQGKYRIDKALDYINEHYCEELNLKKLAKLAALSESQLIRTFRQNYNTTPIGYQLELRLSEAQRLLSDTAMPIFEIAYRLGFCDSNYFSHFFRRKIGITPTQYRKNKE